MTDEALVQVDNEEVFSSSAWDLLTDQPLTLDTIQQFRAKLYRSMNEFDHVRDQLATIPPAATGTDLVRLAVGTWGLGKHAEAIPLLKKLGDQPGAIFCIAISQVALGKLPDARETISKLKAKGLKDHPEVLALEVSTYERSHDWAGMKKTLDAARALEGTAWVHYFRGRIAEEDRQIEEALDLYEQAVAVDPSHAEALFRLGYVLDLRGLDEQARHFYERTIRCIPPNVAAVVNLGIIYEDMGRYRKAMHLYDFVLRTYPTHARARLFRRDSHASLNMYYDEDQERREDKRNQVLRIPITDFELSVRSRNCLSKMNIRTLGDLVKKTEAELLSYKNFGETSLNEIKEILKSKNLRLGMDQEDLLEADLEQPGAAGAASVLQPAEPSAVEGVGGDVSQRPVTESLSVRSRRIIDLLKIKTIGDLAGKTEAELLACPNFGQTSLNEIKAKLEELGLALKG